MLGFGPISSRPISGSPFGLIAVPLAMTATVAVSFGITARAGVFSQMRATAQIVFGGSAFLSVNQAIHGTASITFGGSPTLRVAGKPIIINAVPISFTLRAPPQSYTLKAVSEQFTVRDSR
jgi:hypothetical protein